MSFPSFKEYLVEESREIYFTFGRMNPPTIGHGKLLDKLNSASGRNPYKVFLSQSTDPKKNPLTYPQKVKHVRKMFPSHARNVMMNKKIKTVFDAAVNLYDQGYKKITMVVGSDRVQEFQTLLNKYNGVKGRHGFYNFEKIGVVSAGERDPDAEGVEGMSASKQRANAANNDFTTFSQGVPKSMSNKDAKQLFNDIRVGMGLKEETTFKKHLELETISEEREKFIQGELFEPGDRVIVKESNQSGRIYRLGTNYVIVSLDEGRITRQWIDGITKIEEETYSPQKHEYGTNASRKFASQMTPGQVDEEDEVKAVRKQIDREMEVDKDRHDRMLDRARLARARRKNRETNPNEEKKPKFNPQDMVGRNTVAKHAHKFNKSSVMRDRKKDSKRGYIKHKGQLNGGN